MCIEVENKTAKSMIKLINDMIYKEKSKEFEFPIDDRNKISIVVTSNGIEIELIDFSSNESYMFSVANCKDYNSLYAVILYMLTNKRRCEE